MSKEIIAAEKIEILKTLASGAIERLKQLPQPVVRVSGPLTSGGYGYEENLRRFLLAQKNFENKDTSFLIILKGITMSARLLNLK